MKRPDLKGPQQWGMLVVDSDGYVVACDEWARELLRWDVCAGRSIHDIGIPEGVPLAEGIRIPLMPAVVIDVNGRQVTLHSRWMTISGTSYLVMLIHAGQVVERALVDVREKELVDHVGELERNLAAIMECSRDGIIIIDKDGAFVRWNKRFEEIYQVSGDDITSGSDMVARGLYKYSSSAQALREGRMVTVLNETRAGKQVLSTSIPIFDKDASITGAVANVRDLTEIKELEAKLNESELALKRNEFMISEFRKERTIAKLRFLFHSERMREIVEMAKRVADLDAGVLITGETGVGKSFLAEVLHQAGSRSGKPFVAVNCASIPATLLESELFGYEKGAFTGASNQGKPGMFEMANGGTLFLDEISETPLGLQSKLLDAIERREIRKVGGKERIPLDIRIITATNQELKALAESGSFRKDLYYRLDIIHLVIPPLRERGEDAVVLANEFLERYCVRYNRDVRFGPGVDAVLMAYHWPGNVRELENLILRLLLTTPRDVITKQDVESQISCQPSRATVQVNELMPLKQAVSQLEGELVRRAMETYGSTYKAAKALGISQSSVVRRVHKCINDNA